jgi:hypothetical protein
LILLFHNDTSLFNASVISIAHSLLNCAKI